MDQEWRKQGVRLAVALAVGVFFGFLAFRGGHDEHPPATQPAAQVEAEAERSVWTCAMHPQIRSSEPGRCPICGMALIPLAGAAGGQGQANPQAYAMSPAAAALAQVRTTAVRAAVPDHEVHLTGRLAIDERRVAVVTASYPGRIERLFVAFTGQPVRQGQKLATIYSPELVTAQTELLEAARTRHASPQLYAAAREKLRRWRLTEEQLSAIEAGGTPQTEFDVLAQHAGIVLGRRVSTGDYVSRGSVLFEIADLSRIWVLLDAYEEDLPWVRIGAAVRFSAASIPGREFTSTVTFIDPVLDPRTRTASVRAEVDNPDLALMPEVFVQGRIRAADASRTTRLLIPRTAVLWTGPRSVVHVRVPDSPTPAFQMRQIVLGPRAGDDTVVDSGLAVGEEVVTHGAFAVDAAAQLAGLPSMMSRPAAAPTDRVPAAFPPQVAGLIEAYLSLKDALVDSDLEGARRQAQQGLQALAAVDMTRLAGPAHTLWMQQDGALRDALSRIADAAALQAVAPAFAALSAVVVAVTEDLGPSLETLYVHHCPMALGNAGAYWLSRSEQVRNPYFGQEMLTCGEVLRRIPQTQEPVRGSAKAPLEHRH